MPKRPCELTDAKHHSDDRVQLWHGEITPMILCGYHASWSLPGVIRRVLSQRALGEIA